MTDWTPITAREATQHRQQADEVLAAAAAELREKQDFLARRNVSARSEAGSLLLMDLSGLVSGVEALRIRLERWALDAGKIEQRNRPSAPGSTGQDTVQIVNHQAGEHDVPPSSAAA